MVEEEVRRRPKEINPETETTSKPPEVDIKGKVPEGQINMTIAIIGGVVAALAVGAIYILRSK